MKLYQAYKTSISAVLHIAVLLCYPLVVVASLGIVLIPFFRAYLKETIGFGLLTGLFIAVFFLVSNTSFRRTFLIVSYLVLAFLAFLKLSFYYHYGVKLSASALFVIFETNTTEASDFLSNYFDLKIILLLILFLLPLFFLRKLFSSKSNLFKFREAFQLRTKSLKFRIPILLLIVILGYGIQSKFKAENIFLTSFSSYEEYVITKNILKDNLAKTHSDVFSDVTSEKGRQTYVIVIGESTSSWHMQLYGYHRNTNPLLTEIKDELTIFDSIITPDVHTILALEKILTLSDAKEPNKKSNGSIVQLANHAGFTTYWLSNQRPVGLHESVSTLIGNAATQKNFIATDNYNYDIHDENLFPFLDQILKNSIEKKVLFIHLIGTHGTYKKRYPVAYERFTEKSPNLKYHHKKAISTTNDYDNAVLYNDFIVRTIIEKVRNVDDKSYVAYFSDHGDEVYDTMDLMGHNSYHATPPMHEIPFIVWFSEKYKANRSFSTPKDSLSKRRYSLEDFIHTFSEISDITFKEFDPSKSIFNTEFIKRTRFIKTDVNYDKR